MHNVEHASLLTYLYSCLHPRCVLAYRYTCGFLECYCSRRQRYNLRCSWHTRRYLHYHGHHAWIWRYWQAEHYKLLALSFTPGPKVTSFTNLSHRRLSSGLRTDYTDCMTRPFLLSISDFYSARNASIASAVLAIAIPSVCLSVRPSVRQTPVLCQNGGT